MVVVNGLVSHYQNQDCNIILLSEYGITDVSHPIHLNRVLRENLVILSIRVERGLELLDAGASKAFAVADHQVCHIYLNDKSVKKDVKVLLENVKGVEKVLSDEGT